MGMAEPHGSLTKEQLKILVVSLEARLKNRDNALKQKQKLIEGLEATLKERMLDYKRGRESALRTLACAFRKVLTVDQITELLWTLDPLTQFTKVLREEENGSVAAGTGGGVTDGTHAEGSSEAEEILPKTHGC